MITLTQLERRVKAMIRRMRPLKTAGALWRLAGYAGEVDAEGVELFSGIGFYSRPGSSGKPEVVVNKIGGASGHPVVVATRDESIRVELDEDETAIFNSASIVKIKADGTIEVGSRGGTPVPLATLADVEAIRNDLNGHEHTYVPSGGGTALTTLGPSVTAPSGTAKLKGE